MGFIVPKAKRESGLRTSSKSTKSQKKISENISQSIENVHCKNTSKSPFPPGTSIVRSLPIHLEFDTMRPGLVNLQTFYDEPKSMFSLKESLSRVEKGTRISTLSGFFGHI